MNPNDKKRVIIDTNLWISFLIGRRLHSLPKLIAKSKVRLVFSNELLEEIRAVTSRPQFKRYFNPKDVEELIAFMNVIGRNYKIGNIEPLCRDPKDDFLLALAVCSKAHYLITGDKDLLELGQIADCKIVTVAEFEDLF